MLISTRSHGTLWLKAALGQYKHEKCLQTLSNREEASEKPLLGSNDEISPLCNSFSFAFLLRTLSPHPLESVDL